MTGGREFQKMDIIIIMIIIIIIIIIIIFTPVHKQITNQL